MTSGIACTIAPCPCRRGPGSLSAPNAPKDPRHKPPPGSCLPGVPTENPSPSLGQAEPKTSRAQAALPARVPTVWRGLRGSGRHPRGAPTHPGRVSRAVTSGVYRSSRRHLSPHSEEPAKCSLVSTSWPSLQGPGLSPQARAHRRRRRRDPRSPRRRPHHRLGGPPSYVPEVPGVGGAGAESRPPRSPDSNENSDSNLAQSAAIGRGPTAADQWEGERARAGRGLEGRAGPTGRRERRRAPSAPRRTPALSPRGELRGTAGVGQAPAAANLSCLPFWKDQVQLCSEQLHTTCYSLLGGLKCFSFKAKPVSFPGYTCTIFLKNTLNR